MRAGAPKSESMHSDATRQLAACERGHLFVTSRQRMRTMHGIPCELCWVDHHGRGYPVDDRVVLAVWRLAGIEAAQQFYDDERSTRDRIATTPGRNA